MTVTNELCESIKKWWQEHKYDTTGDYGEYNVFDDEPEFVTKAKEIIGDWEMKNNKEVKVVFNGEEKTIFCKDSKNVTIDELNQAGLQGYCRGSSITITDNADGDFGKCVKVAADSEPSDQQQDDDKIYETLQSAIKKLSEMRGTEFKRSYPVIICNMQDKSIISASLDKHDYKLCRNGAIKLKLRVFILNKIKVMFGVK